MKHVVKYALEMHAPTVVREQTVTQNDAIEFVFTLLKGGEPIDMTGVTPSLAVKRRDGVTTALPGTVDGNTVTFALGSTETAKPGPVYAAVQLYGADGRVSSLPFSFQVKGDLTAAGTIPSESEATLIEVVLQDGPAILQRAETAAADAERVAVENKTNWLDAVTTVAERDTAYPSPKHGDTVRVTGTATVYRYEDGKGWVVTDKYQQSAVDALNQQLADKANSADLTRKRDKTEPITLNDMDSGTLAAIEGGGSTSFNLESIPRNYSVSPVKTTFMQQTQNLFTGEYVHGLLTKNANTPAGKLYLAKNYGSLSGRLAIIPVSPNTTYTVNVHEPGQSNSFRIATTNEYPQIPETLNEYFVSTVILDGGTSRLHTFTTDGNAKYLIVYVTSEGKEPLLQVERGSVATPYKEPFVLPGKFLPEPKPVAIDKLEFARQSRNLFDGVYTKGYLHRTTGVGLFMRKNTASVDGRVAIVPIEANKTYTVKIHEPEKSHAMRIGITNNLPVFSDTLNSQVDTAILEDSTAKEYTFTNTSAGRYALFYVSNAGGEPLLKVEEGTTASPYTGKFVIPAEYVELPDFERGEESGYYFYEDLDGVYDSPEPIGVQSGSSVNLANRNAQYVYDLYDGLMAENPNYISRKIIGYATATDGSEDTSLPIYEYHFKQKRTYAGDGVKSPLVIVQSGLHGGEATAVWATWQTFEDMCRNYEGDSVKEFLRFNVDFKVVPLANPSGFSRNTRTNARGIDLNRNFSERFEIVDQPGSQYYSGTQPMSEQETKTLARWYAENQDCICMIDMHNYAVIPPPESGTRQPGTWYLTYFIADSAWVRTMLRNVTDHLERKWRKLPQFSVIPAEYDAGHVTPGRTHKGWARLYAYNKLGIESIVIDPVYRVHFIDTAVLHDADAVRVGIDSFGAALVGMLKNIK